MLFLLLLRVLPVAAMNVDCQLLEMGATAESSKTSCTGTLSLADNAIVTSVFVIARTLSPRPLLLRSPPPPPSLLGSFGPCVTTGSPFSAIFSTSKVIGFKIAYRCFEIIHLSLSWLSRGTASLAQFAIKQLVEESKFLHSANIIMNWWICSIFSLLILSDNRLLQSSLTNLLARKDCSLFYEKNLLIACCKIFKNHF